MAFYTKYVDNFVIAYDVSVVRGVTVKILYPLDEKLKFTGRLFALLTQPFRKASPFGSSQNFLAIASSFWTVPPGSLGPSYSPVSHSAILDRVCSLKRSAVCSASSALVDDMTGSNIFYCVPHTFDSV